MFFTLRLKARNNESLLCKTFFTVVKAEKYYEKCLKNDRNLSEVSIIRLNQDIKNPVKFLKKGGL